MSMNVFSRALALIPARGGSKGIPRKNLEAVGGIPLVGRTIQAAFASERVVSVLVSTDDADIASVARSYGADVVMRPSEISGDTASSESALIHALDLLKKSLPLPENLCFLQCTSPFTTGEQIDRVLAALDSPLINSSFAVLPWHGFLWREDGRGVNHDPEKPRQRRQDLEPSFLEAGSIYAMRTHAFQSTRSRFCSPWKPIVIDDFAPEIDTLSDLHLCRAINSIITQ